MSEESPFRAELVRNGQHFAVIEVSGEASESAAPKFKEMLLKSIDGDARTVIVDFTAARLTDNAILGTLVGCAQWAQSRRVHLDVIGVDQSISRVFEITGLDRIIGVYGSRDEALRAERRGSSLTAETGRS